MNKKCTRKPSLPTRRVSASQVCLNPAMPVKLLTGPVTRENKSEYGGCAPAKVTHRRCRPKWTIETTATILCKLSVSVKAISHPFRRTLTRANAAVDCNLVRPAVNGERRQGSDKIDALKFEPNRVNIISRKKRKELSRTEITTPLPGVPSVEG